VLQARPNRRWVHPILCVTLFSFQTTRVLGTEVFSHALFLFLFPCSVFTSSFSYSHRPGIERHENENHTWGATGPPREKRCHKPHSPKKNVLVGSVPFSWLSFLVALCMCSVYTRMPCIFNRDSMLQGNVSNGVTALSILAQVL